jgi:hypothetical protein
MSDRPRQFAELAVLIDALLDDVITEEQLTRLQDLVENDANARRYYVDALNLHANLHWHLHPQVPAEEKSRVAETLKPTPLALAYRFFDRPTPISLTISASVLALLILAMAYMSPPFYRSLTHSPSETSVETKRIIAEITAERQTRWADGRAERNVLLTPGQRLKLVEGALEVTYRDGVVVVLQAPCNYVATELGRGTLTRGRLLARVPDSAHGFRVRTPSAVVQDLGTEFGVDVGPDGGAEVVVLAGVVELFRDDAKGARRIRLTKHQRASIAAQSGAVRLTRPISPELAVAMREEFLIDAASKTSSGAVSFTSFKGGTTAPTLDTSFGQLELAYNFGGTGEQIEDGIRFTDNSALGDNPTYGTTNGITVAASTQPPQGQTSRNFNNDDIGDDLWQAFSYTDKGGALTLAITGLDAGRKYQVQLLFGDNRDKWYGNYVNQRVTATVEGSGVASTALSFGAETGNPYALLTIELSGSSFVKFTMPAAAPKVSAGPSIAGVVVHSQAAPTTELEAEN